MKRKILFTVMLLLPVFFSFTVSAAETPQEFYAEQYDRSGARELWETMPESAREYFEENGLDPGDYSWVDAFSAENVFGHIWRFLTSGLKTTRKTGATMLAMILITAAFGCLEQQNGAVKMAVYTAAVASAALMASSVFSVVGAGVNALKGVSAFMLGFIPVFAVIVAVSGAAVTSVSMSALLLTAAQGVSFFSGFLVAPLMSGYLALSISAGISPLMKKAGIAEALKKLSLWIMGFISAVFVAILGIQTAVNSAADTVSVKTAKFIIGSAVPVAGGVLSEALTTVTASMGLLRSSIGIYGVAVCLLTLLPILVEILIWRATLFLGTVVSELFSVPRLSGIFKAFDTVLSMLSGILLLVGAMFVISLGVVIAAGRQL